MASWTELLKEIEIEKNSKFLTDKIQEYLNKISELRNNRVVIAYFSSFLQKPNLNFYDIAITMEDINGFMTCLCNVDCSKELTLILHTPGGDTNAIEPIVDYLHKKFQYIEVIIPTYAMSAGTSISLASNKIIMAKHSQLGPIDPQIVINNKSVSVQSILDQL